MTSSSCSASESIPARGIDLLEARPTRIHDALQVALAIGDHHRHVSASIGIARTNGDDPVADLIHHADLAMYQAKRQGLGRTFIHDAA
uniref:diguanylate cyclase domain-containing protein n=1 Tax=Nakamurella alba TaxID=2665158 RepID=UPI0038991AC2